MRFVVMVVLLLSVGSVLCMFQMSVIFCHDSDYIIYGFFALCSLEASRFRGGAQRQQSIATMSAKCAVYDANAVVVDHEALGSEKNVSGNVTTGATELGETSKLTTGVWEHSAGISTDVESDEVFVILSGKGRIYVDGEVLELYPGVVGTLYAGASTRWEIDEPIRKVYIFPRAEA